MSADLKAPAERPILFSGPMICALLDGRKTQTRRAVKGAPVDVVPFIGADDMPTGEFGLCLTHERVINKHVRCPYGVPGDRLWVKETWRPRSALNPWDLNVTYAADGAERTIMDGEFSDRDWIMPKAAARGNVSPLFMPRWASRLTLQITDVRVERLLEISEVDAEAEGSVYGYGSGAAISQRRMYELLWEHINGPGSWDANPYVWAVSFEVMR